MKRRYLLRAIGDAAHDRHLIWLLVREGAEHEVWSLDGRLVVIPRHREINELTARGIRQELESKLGDRWWER